MCGTLKAARISEVAFESVRLSQTGLCEKWAFLVGRALRLKV
jgi:hypothetical protein